MRRISYTQKELTDIIKGFAISSSLFNTSSHCWYICIVVLEPGFMLAMLDLLNKLDKLNSDEIDIEIST